MESEKKINFYIYRKKVNTKQKNSIKKLLKTLDKGLFKNIQIYIYNDNESKSFINKVKSRKDNYLSFYFIDNSAFISKKPNNKENNNLENVIKSVIEEKNKRKILISSRDIHKNIYPYTINTAATLPLINHIENVCKILKHKNKFVINTDNKLSKNDFLNLENINYLKLNLSSDNKKFFNSAADKKKFFSYIKKINHKDCIILDFKNNKELKFILSNLPLKKDLIVVTPIYGGEPMPILNELIVRDIDMQQYFEVYKPKLLFYPYGFEKLRVYNLSKLIKPRPILVDEIGLIVDVILKLKKQNFTYIDYDLIKKEILKFDGNNDIFLGISKDYVFNKELKNINYNWGLNISKQTLINGKFFPILLEHQVVEKFTKNEPYFEKINTHYINIFMKKIFYIDTSKGIWSCNFELQIKSPIKNLFNNLIFNNLSKNNYFFKKNDLEIRKIKDKFLTRYDISANFYFEDKHELYPFDSQSISIEVCLDNEKKIGILSPLNYGKLNSEFDIDSWKIVDTFSGIKREKTFNYVDDEKDKEVIYRRSIILNYVVTRLSQISFFKIIIPIFFLIAVVLLTLFYNFESDTSGISILTTTFLSGIALYFSTEKPKADNLTNLDLVFTYYYFFNGLSLIILFIEFLYKQDLLYFKFTLFPLPIFAFFHFILRHNNNKNKIYNI